MGGAPPSWGLGDRLTTLHRKNLTCHEELLLNSLGLGQILWKIIVPAVLNGCETWALTLEAKGV